MNSARGRNREARPNDEMDDHPPDEPEIRNADQPSRKTMGAAFRILAARACSEGELRDRLTVKPWADSKIIESCIARLKELGYVNDDLFAKSYASYRVGLKPLGRARLARELAARKVSRNRIDTALDVVFADHAEETLIDRAIGRRVRTHGRPSDKAAAKRMFDHLARLGFEYELISRKLRALKADNEEE